MKKKLEAEPTILQPTFRDTSLGEKKSVNKIIYYCNEPNSVAVIQYMFANQALKRPAG